MLFRPHFAAATVVVPVPRKGSRTVSPYETKHPYEALGELEWIGSGMVFGPAPSPRILRLIVSLLGSLVFNRYRQSGECVCTV
jgi:hypothetical protein